MIQFAFILPAPASDKAVIYQLAALLVAKHQWCGKISLMISRPPHSLNYGDKDLERSDIFLAVYSRQGVVKMTVHLPIYKLFCSNTGKIGEG